MMIIFYSTNKISIFNNRPYGIGEKKEIDSFFYSFHLTFAQTNEKRKTD